MMKKLLLVVWCVKLADEKPLHPEFTAQYIFTSSKSIKSPGAKFSPIVKQTISKNKITEPEFASAISFSAPEEFDSSNHDSGYSMLSKTFTKSKKNGKDDSKYILDKRVLYDSLNNPLFKSKSLNFEDENESPRLVGDIYKITSPFESKWILSPKLTKLIDDNRNNLMDEFLHVFDSLKVKKLREREKNAVDPSDSLFPAPSNLDLERYNNLGGDTVDNLENIGKDQFNENVKDSAIIFKDLKDESIFKELDDKPHLNEISPVSVPKNASYVGYNVQEVKTPQGVQGVMQIFDKNGLAQKIHYNEQGVLNQANNTKVPQINKSASSAGKKKNPSDTNLQNVVKTAVNQLKPNTNSKLIPPKNNTSIKISKDIVTKNPLAPEIKQISVKIEGHNFSKNNPHDPINDLQRPENILSDFLDQLNGVSDISNNANVRTDVHNTFHETISEKSYSYMK